MANIIQCAHCSRNLKVAADAVGKAVRCPSCKGTTTVPAGPAVSSPEPYSAELVTSSPPRRRPDDFDEPRKPRRERRDDDFDRPLRRQKKKSGSPMVWILAGAGGLIFLIAIIGVVVLLNTRRSIREIAEADGPDANVKELTPQKLAVIKRATVYVKVEGKVRGNGVSGSGSGFVTRVDGDSALIVTNHHVVDSQLLIVGQAPLIEPEARINVFAQVRPIPPIKNNPPKINPPKNWPVTPPQNWQPPRQFVPFKPVAPRVMIERLKDVQVTVVFDSGLKTERSVKAAILGVDPGWDLAVLEVKNLKDLPEPISYMKNPELTETMQVYSAGFPLGKQLALNGANPAISIGKTTISSLRHDKDGDLAIVQIDGTLSPGSSGGPVVDARGELVGIAVAIMRDAKDIGLLIPGVELRKTMQQGRIGIPHLASSQAGAGKPSVQVEAVLVDPMDNMAGVTLYYVPGSQAKNLPGDLKSLENMPGLEKIDLTLKKQLATGDLTLNSPESELVTQIMQTNKDGKKYIHKVYRQPIGNGEPVKVAGPVNNPDKQRPVNPPIPKDKEQVFAQPINRKWDEKTLSKVYLSDMLEINPKVGFGQFGKNGMLGYGGDNVPIMVADQAYPKGLSMHPPNHGKSSVNYRLGGNAKIFRTLIGVNDLPDTRTPDTFLRFRVLGDGKLLWVSAPLRLLRSIQECKINVENVDLLELQVDCPGPHGHCRTVWLDPYVLKSSVDVKNDKLEQNRTYLTDMPEIDPKVGFGQFSKNGMLGYLRGNPRITVAGRVYVKGLSTHPPTRGFSSVKYRLEGNAKHFHTLIGVNEDVENLENPDKRGPESPLEFRVIGDGKILWASDPLQELFVTRECKIDVENVQLLELQVHCPGSFARGHTVWLDPYVLK